jgi:hypothetical protein
MTVGHDFDDPSIGFQAHPHHGYGSPHHGQPLA